MLFDTHCHLDFSPLFEEVEGVLERARQAGVTRLLTIGTDLATSRVAVDLAERFPPVLAAVGIHPNEAAEAVPDSLTVLSELATHPGVVAVGEIGLDFYRDRTPASLQRSWFERQWELAGRLGLPVIVHCREAMGELLELLETGCRGLPDPGLENRRGILHCFSGTAEEARRTLELGFDIGIGGPVTYPRNEPLRQLVRSLPGDRFHLETDAPFLAPQKKRGKPNEPAHLRLTAEKVAEIRDEPLDHLAAAATRNAERLFHRETGER